MNPFIVDFYLNGGKNNEGLTFDQMLASSDEELERSHTFVQWLFPLNEESAHSRHAPVLTAEQIVVFATPEGRAQYARALDRFMKFFGMSLVRSKTGDVLWVEPDQQNDTVEEFPKREDNFTPRAKFWLRRGNHNLKRITRIIRCAMLLGLKSDAERIRVGFSDLAKHPFGQFNLEPVVLDFWSDAVNLPFDQQLNTLLPNSRVHRT